MPATSPATTTSRTLDAVITTLAKHEMIEGILIMGSAATGDVSSSSDYDLLIAFDESPAPLRMVMTWIDRLPAEIYCTTIDDVLQIVSTDTALPAMSERAVIAGWLRNGRVAFDRSGKLSAACAQANSVRIAMPDDRAIYETWRRLSYNLVQTRRYATSSDPNAQVAADLRLLYCAAEVMTGYFVARGLAWTGEKNAIRYWQERDSTFLERFQAYFAARDLLERFMVYEELVIRGLAPVGLPWDRGQVAVELGTGYGSSQAPDTGDPATALSVWEHLIAPQ